MATATRSVATEVVPACETPSLVRALASSGRGRVASAREPGELLALRRHGFDLVTLGPRTLRTDVALVGLVALVQDWLDS